MYLLINTNNNQIALCSDAQHDGSPAWKDIEKEASFVFQVKALLEAENLESSDIKGAVIIQGRGSYSDTRTGIVFANIFKLLKNIPIVALQEDRISQTMPLNQVLAQLLEGEKGYVKAEYASEPNITKS